MAKKPPQKGSVQWHPLPAAPEDYKNVEVGIKYVGAHQARTWMLEYQRLQLTEKGALLAAGLGPDDHTPDFFERLFNLYRQVISECLAGARGVEGMADTDTIGAMELIEYLGDEVEIGIFNLAQEQQRLTLRQQFRA